MLQFAVCWSIGGPGITPCLVHQLATANCHMPQPQYDKRIGPLDDVCPGIIIILFCLSVRLLNETAVGTVLVGGVTDLILACSESMLSSSRERCFSLE